jgi:hypothetical protein
MTWRKRQQVGRLAVAEPDLADARGDGHGQHGQQEPAEDRAAAVVAVPGPAVQPPDQQDGADEQVEAQVQAQRHGRVDPPAGGQARDGVAQARAGPPADGQRRGRGQPGQRAHRDAAVG